MPHADLHVHTARSDGTLALDAVPAAARRAGVAVVGVTDHDRLQPGLPAPVTVRDGVTLVHGIELKVETDAQRLDLLGYGVEPMSALESEVDRLQADRRERGRAIVERVEDRLGVDLGVEPRAGLGRPHIARAIAEHPDAPYDVESAFEHLIGDGRPCFVAREVTPYARGRELLEEAAAVVALAHPLRLSDPAAALALASDLDAVERWYPYDDPVDPAPVERAIATHDLLATGGSDAHDERLGRAGVPAADYGPIAARLPAPAGR
ncbi:MAG: PHP domain-containing protein [Halobacteriales archaeon]